jgi:hypothetical protein
MIGVTLSENRKLGSMGATYRGIGRSRGGTCPSTCPLWKKGCYAEYSCTRIQADRAGKTTRQDADKLFNYLTRLPKNHLVRLHVTGDFFTEGGKRVDAQYLFALARAAICRPDLTIWTYTHARGRALRRILKFTETLSNVTVNVSCDSMSEAVRMFDDEELPVVVSAGEDFKDISLDGVKFRICSAQKSDKITCNKCRLCARKDRDFIIAFLAHGTGKKCFQTWL